MEPPADDNSPTVQQPLMDVTETDAYREKIIAFVNPKSYVDVIETEYNKKFYDFLFAVVVCKVK